MNLHDIRKTNSARSVQWHKGKEWDVNKWGIAMAGEAGEVCDAIKKYNRVVDELAADHGPTTIGDAVADIADEIADTILYLDLLAEHLGIDLDDAIRSKFNRVSERYNFPQRL